MKFDVKEFAEKGGYLDTLAQEEVRIVNYMSSLNDQLADMTIVVQEANGNFHVANCVTGFIPVANLQIMVNQ